MGDFFSPSESSSASYEERIATTGDASPVGRDSAAVASGGSFVVGSGARYSESGSILADTANVGNIQAGGDVTLGLKGGEVGGLVDSFNRASSDQISAFNALLRKEQDTVVELAGDTKSNTAFAWIAAAAIAALVLPGLFKRS